MSGKPSASRMNFQIFRSTDALGGCGKTGDGAFNLVEKDFEGFTWFALKVLTPNREYLVDPSSAGRFNPEIDHIFPKGPWLGRGEEYRVIDSIWNMQPVKGEVNNFKRTQNPKDFFFGESTGKYKCEYDFLPAAPKGDPIWDDPLNFISYRKEEMKKFLSKTYHIELHAEPGLT